MTEADWLAALADAPDALRTRMTDALGAVDAGGALADRLAAAAVLCLRTAIALGDDRAGAIHLLAADALLTDGATLAAADGPEAAADYARRWDVRALAQSE